MRDALKLILLQLLIIYAASSRIEDLGYIVIGDEIYLDSETFLNHDFSENPGYFVYPIPHKSAFEMYSVPKGQLVPSQLGCDGVAGIVTAGIIYNCRNKLKFFSLVEREIMTEFRIPEETKCTAVHKDSERKIIILLCRKIVGIKVAKIYLMTFRHKGKKSKIGVFTRERNPLLTGFLNDRFEVLVKPKRLSSNHLIVWNAPHLEDLGKVKRYENNKFFIIDLAQLTTTELYVDFSSMEEEMVYFSFAKFHPLDESTFIVFIRGYMKSQSYKFNRYESSFECIWDKGSAKVDRCREIIIFENGENNRIAGNLLSIRVKDEPPKEGELYPRRKVNLLYNEPVKGGSIYSRMYTYKVLPYKKGDVLDHELDFEAVKVFRRMMKNQYVPLYMGRNKVYYKDVFTKFIRLVSWYNPEKKKMSIRYIHANNVIEHLEEHSICSLDQDSLMCYDWSSDTYLKSETKHISKAYRYFNFYLNHCDRIDCFSPYQLEMRAELSETLAISNLRHKENITMNVSAMTGDVMKIANSRSIVNRSSISRLINIDNSLNNIYVEKFKEVKFSYAMNPKFEFQIVGEKHTYNFGNVLLDCTFSECSIYQNCKEYDYIDKVWKICAIQEILEEINEININKVIFYEGFLIVFKKGVTPGVFIYDTTKKEKFSVLTNQISEESRKVSITFNGFDMYVSTLVSNGRVDIFQISFERKVQKLLKTLNSKAKCSTDIGSNAYEQFYVTIYSKCRNEPPKIITYRSTNMETFVKDIYYPKAAILGEDGLSGMCVFKQGVLFVTQDSLYFHNRNNNFFIRSRPFLGTSNKYKVKCFYPGLISFYHSDFVHIFDLNYFYKTRHRNSVRYNVRDTDMITDGGDGNFYVTAGIKREKTRFYKLFWRNKDIFGLFKKSGIYNGLLSTDMLDDKPIPLQINVTLIDEVHPDWHKVDLPGIVKNRSLIPQKTDGRYCLDSLIPDTLPLWDYTISSEDGMDLQECLAHRVIFKTISKQKIIAHDSFEGNVYFSAQGKFKGSYIGMLEEDPETKEVKQHQIKLLSGRCNHIKLVKDYPKLALFVYCKQLGRNSLHLIQKQGHEYIDSYVMVDHDFTMFDVLSAQEDTYLLAFYNSYLRYLHLDMFIFVETDGFKVLRYKNSARKEGSKYLV